MKVSLLAIVALATVALCTPAYAEHSGSNNAPMHFKKSIDARNTGEECDCIGKDGSTFPVAGDSGKFYLCNGNIATTISCPKGTYYNVNFGACLMQSTGDCEQKCLPQSDGVVFPSTNGDKSTFCVCLGGEAILKTCLPDYVFDSFLNICQLGTGDDCNSPCDSSQCNVWGDFVPFQAKNSNTGFCWCQSNVAKFESCPENAEFEPEFGACLASQDSTCSSGACIAAKCANLPLNSPFPAENTTNGFCVCKEGGPQFVHCLPNTVFQEEFNACVPPTESSCNGPCDSSQCAALGDFIPFKAKNTTAGFCWCQNNDATYESCPENAEFEPEFGACLASQDSTCSSGACIAAKCASLPLNSPFPAENTTNGFCVCKEGGPQFVHCLPNTVFQEEFNACVPPTESSCNGPCDSSQCAALGDFIPFKAKNTTAGFCWCQNNDATYESCPENAEFEPEFGACLASQDSTCSSGACIAAKCANLPLNSPFPAENTTNGFCVCKEGGPQFVHCLPNTVFQEEFNACVPPTESSCNGPCDSSQCAALGDFIPFKAKNTTAGFCWCQNNDATYESCPENAEFELEFGACLASQDSTCSSGACIAAKCASLPLNSPFPAENTTNGFCVCKEGGPQFVHCLPNTVFQEEFNACVPPTESSCNDPCDSIQCAALGDFIPFKAKNTTAGFCWCQNNDATYESCPENAEFELEFGACLASQDSTCSSGACIAAKCANLPLNSPFPAENTTNGFCVCKEGGPQFVHCLPNTVFQEEFNACVPSTESSCNGPCDSSQCAALGDFIPFKAKNTTAGFCWCQNNDATYESCPENAEFEPEFGACLASQDSTCSSGACIAAKCASLPLNSPFPAENTTNGFCVCKEGGPQFVHCLPNTVFQEEFNACVPPTESNCNGLCDSSQCAALGDFIPFKAKNTTAGFCWCQNNDATYESCPENAEFEPEFGACLASQDSTCSSGACIAAKCASLSLNSPFPAENTTNGFCVCKEGGPQFVHCLPNTVFQEEFNACVPPTESNCNGPCDSSKCAALGDFIPFKAKDTTAGFCWCQNNVAKFESCPENAEFEPEFGACLASQDSTCTSGECNELKCRNLQPDSVVSADYTSNGFCVCKQGGAEFVHCPTTTLFNQEFGVCLPISEDSNRCNYIVCQSLENDYPYAATGSLDGFCLCKNGNPYYTECPPNYQFDEIIGICLEAKRYRKNYRFVSDRVDKDASYVLHSTQNKTCSDGHIFNDKYGVCENYIKNDELCPRGVMEGDVIFNPSNCQMYFVCTNGRLQEGFCTNGKFFNESLKSCEYDNNGVCVPSFEIVCDGGYQEGQLVSDPSNTQLYYLCYQGKLQTMNCGNGNKFSILEKACVSNTRKIKRSIDSMKYLLSCKDEEKRSVPLNCTEYEICTNSTWIRKACHEQRYYNPEQQRCLVPRDDMVCSYVKVPGLPPCDNITESQTLPSKNGNCNQYYRCLQGKWRLRTCPKKHFYERTLRTCIISTSSNNCEQEVFSTKENGVHESKLQCQHTSVRAATNSCSTYLMCLENEWWKQQCPLGMYFNRTYNYCMPNDNAQCEEVTQLLDQEDYFTKLNCTQQRTHRASSMSCNKYYTCIEGRWKNQTCTNGSYYNATMMQCLLDTNGYCVDWQISRICKNGSRRAFLTNCTAYELCSANNWVRVTCPDSLQYDTILEQCVPSDGSCTLNGGRRACRIGEVRQFPLAQNCTQFYYCEEDTWNVGTCLKGHTYSALIGACVPHASDDKCQPIWQQNQTIEVTVEHEIQTKSNTTDTACQGQADGFAVPHPDDCTQFFLCIEQIKTSAKSCATGSFFDAQLGYCRPNDGSCRLTLTGVCAGANDGSIVPNPDDCRAYYSCSTINGTQIHYCPDGEYYHNLTRQCRVDHGQCRQQDTDKGICDGLTHGTRLSHEIYCNIYYACVRGLAIPVECPVNYQFNSVLGECVFDDQNQCQNGLLVDGNNITYSCGNFQDGYYLADRTDCTRYYICLNGTARPQRCGTGTFFDSAQLLCIPDDGSCPYVDDDQPNGQNVPPDPIVCESENKHGYMMPDPNNCNNFYVCILGKLRHERCYSDFYFNSSLMQCQPMPGNDTDTDTDNNGNNDIDDNDNIVQSKNSSMNVNVAITVSQKLQQCSDKPTALIDLCDEITEGSSIAEQGDCRRYITCEDGEIVSQRCRNGESYDSLFGFCRQNDGTCLLENGERAGVCSGRHGQLVRDVDNCRGYFVCINGQTIEGTCADDEYFNRTDYSCQKDILNQCIKVEVLKIEESRSVSCTGLNETILYPYVNDKCRSYFQCSKGKAKVRTCPDGHYFDYSVGLCVHKTVECAMPTVSITP